MIRLKKAFANAFAGVKWAVKTQPNFKIHFSLAILSLVGAAFFKISYGEFLILLVFIFIGLMIEMLNTAIEKTNDAIDKTWREDIKLAKDLSAGAMLVFSIGAFLVALIIFGPRIYNFCFKVCQFILQ